jgi:mRNA interferase MazF
VRRGDLVTVVQPGAYGKQRPALIIQSDLFSMHPSVTVLPITSDLRDTPLFRLSVEPSESNGLRTTSQIMIDKITTVPREKARDVFGKLEAGTLKEAQGLLAVWLGIG